MFHLSSSGSFSPRSLAFFSFNSASLADQNLAKGPRLLIPLARKTDPTCDLFAGSFWPSVPLRRWPWRTPSWAGSCGTAPRCSGRCPRWSSPRWCGSAGRHRWGESSCGWFRSCQGTSCQTREFGTLSQPRSNRDTCRSCLWKRAWKKFFLFHLSDIHR